MAQAGYFSCMGCGRVFKTSDHEIAEYGLHNCDEPEDRLICPGYRNILLDVLDKIRRK